MFTKGFGPTANEACELPMNGTLPVELIAVPAGYTRCMVLLLLLLLLGYV